MWESLRFVFLAAPGEKKKEKKDPRPRPMSFLFISEGKKRWDYSFMGNPSMFRTPNLGPEREGEALTFPPGYSVEPDAERRRGKKSKTLSTINRQKRKGITRLEAIRTRPTRRVEGEEKRGEATAGRGWLRSLPFKEKGGGGGKNRLSWFHEGEGEEKKKKDG